MDHDYVLQKLIPYRLGAVSVLATALKYRFHWDDPKPMEIYFDGKLAIEGIPMALPIRPLSQA